MAAIFFWFADKVLPGLKVALFPQLEALSKEKKMERFEGHHQTDKSYTQPFAAMEGAAPGWGGCPYHAQLQEMGQGQKKFSVDEKLGH